MGKREKNPTTAKDIFWFFAFGGLGLPLRSFAYYHMGFFFISSNLLPILGCCRKNASWLFTCPLCMLWLLSCWTDLSSALLSSPQSKDRKSKWHSLEFWMMLTSLQPLPPAKVGRLLVTGKSLVAHSPTTSVTWMSCRIDWHLSLFALVVGATKAKKH